MVKTEDIKKLEKQLEKKEAEKKRYETRVEADKAKIKVLSDDITLLQAKIITENLTRQNMTFHDLQDMLSQKSN